MLMRELGDTTFARYERAWNLLVPALLKARLVIDPSDFAQWEHIPLFKLATLYG